MSSLPEPTPIPNRVRQRSRRPSQDAVLATTDADLDSAVARFTAKVIERPIADLQPSPRNARTHSKKQLHQIAGSIGDFGFVAPVLIDRHDVIVSGHGRVEAAKLLGMSTVPTIVLDHLDPDQLRALALAENRLAELAGWDNDLLKIEMSHLLEINFDVELTGFDTPQIDMCRAVTKPSNEAPPFVVARAA